MEVMNGEGRMIGKSKCIRRIGLRKLKSGEILSDIIRK